MTGLPSFPTDNLYKFYAIVGIGIAMFALYCDWVAVQPAWARYYAVEKSQKRAAIEAEYATNLIERHRGLGSAANPDEDLILEKDRKLKDAENKAAQEEADAYEGLLSRLEWYLYVGAGIGIVFSIYGFWKWTAIQRIQDKLMGIELTNAEKTHSSTSRSVGSRQAKPNDS